MPINGPSVARKSAVLSYQLIFVSVLPSLWGRRNSLPSATFHGLAATRWRRRARNAIWGVDVFLRRGWEGRAKWVKVTRFLLVSFVLNPMLTVPYLLA